MENKKYVVGNMKTLMDRKSVSKYLKIVNDKIFSNQVILFPTSIYVPYFLNQYYRVGLQNIYFESMGSYTGEIVPIQAKSMGISCVLIGHSDRRLNFKETDSIINKKVLECLMHGLSVILCVGETLEEKELLKTTRVLKKQITYALRDVDDFRQIIIAYEPVWAIGTRKVPKNEEIKSAIQYIKDIVATEFGYADIKVLYGGSIDSKNIHTICKIDELDGVLVGNASTDAKEFLDIIEVVLNK